MKKLIIYLLVIIGLILIYGQYKQYNRFKLENYEYKTAKGIDLNYHDKAFLLDYYEAVEDLNNYVKAQWSANGIDVRVPEDEDEETKVAAKAYTKKLANVKYYEGQLLQSKKLKKQGMTNAGIRSYERNGITLEDKIKQEHRDKLLTMFGDVSNTVKLGDKSAFVYEVQELLKAKGEEVAVDGVFETMTEDAIRSFETKQKLYPDGQLDVFTLEKLLK
ncbi:MAG: peptidoglycan-binding domain-containing protein [Crocinitomicaceae bacterium]|nr:peptidoglycan-binding domain-containing protein [Crocinitomicaceae bacterium]